ncbi:MAG: hypothetical protein QOI61_2311 [Actinomycetota bacterium]
MRTIALVAAKDGEASIAATVTALAALNGVEETWVVDDGSTDATAARAAEAGAQVVRLDRNVGKGGALAAGVAATPQATRYLLADADLGASAAGLQPLLAVEGDLVVGVLPSAGGRGGFGVVKRLARGGIRRASGFVAESPISGQRVVDAVALRSLVLASRFGVEVGMTIDLVRGGRSVHEVPVEVEHHHRGKSLGGFAHRARQGADIAGALLPRMTTPIQRVAAVVLAGLLAFGALSGLSYVRRAPEGAAVPRADKVLLFAFDGLSLEDLGREDLPYLRSLTGAAATGALSVRTTDRRSLGRRAGPERPSLPDAFASVGASARVRSGGANMAAARELARRDHAAGLPGALGDALHAAGKKTAVIPSATSAAAAALMDRFSKVDQVAPEDADVVLNYAGGVGGLESQDAALGAALASFPANALVVVFSPTPPDRDWELTPVVVAGRGVGFGSIASSTTRRQSLGGLVDLGPTTLAALGIPVPAAMTGAALRVTGDAPDIAALQRLEVDGAVRSRFFLPAAVGYTVIGIVFYLAFIAALRFRAGPSLRQYFRVGACVAAAFPLATLFTGAMQHWWHRGGESPVVLALVAALIGLLAERLRGVGPVYLIAWLALGVIVVDVAATGPLHASSILGYSIQTTGRFYGLPNASFAVYAASLFLVAAAVRGARPTHVRATAGATVLAVGVAFVAAPWLGNDVGGVLTLLPVGAAASWAFFGRRLTRRALAVGVVGVLVLFAALVVVEAVAGGGTHLGRAASDSGSLRNTLTRRVDANVGLLVDQWWGFLSIGLALFAAWALAVGRRWADYLPVQSPLRIAAVATLIASVVGFAVNDSGPVVNVLCLVVLAPAMALTALSGRVQSP